MSLFESELPPYEFAYGAPIESVEKLPVVVQQFLSLPDLDPAATHLETYVGSESCNDLQPLIRYVQDKQASRPELKQLLSELQDIDQIIDQNQKSIKLIEVLVKYRHLLRDEDRQDDIIIFINYGVRAPENLSYEAREQIDSLVMHMDTDEDVRVWQKGDCPSRYLCGNLNIYPLALENTCWHRLIDVGTDKERPILELRFMGLKGIFSSLLSDAERQMGVSFYHLDGDQIEKHDKS